MKSSGKALLRATRVAPGCTQYFRRMLSRRLPPRCVNDYATHLPVLVGLGMSFKVRRVLEFGCGRFSTAVFLNRSAFPELSYLRSLEDDQDWLERISAEIVPDARLDLTLARGLIERHVSEQVRDAYDLIFVDNAREATQRAQTIASIAEHCLGHELVVIHDFEVQAYRTAAGAFRRKFEFVVFNPTTAVVWHGPEIEPRLRAIATLIKQNARCVAVDAIDMWCRIFGGGVVDSGG